MIETVDPPFVGALGRVYRVTIGASYEKKAAAAPFWFRRFVTVTATCLAEPLPSGVKQLSAEAEVQDEVAHRVPPIRTETLGSVWPKLKPRTVIGVPDEVGALARMTCVRTGASYE
jgi:hypothetical protein